MGPGVSPKLGADVPVRVDGSAGPKRPSVGKLSDGAQGPRRGPAERGRRTTNAPPGGKVEEDAWQRGRPTPIHEESTGRSAGDAAGGSGVANSRWTTTMVPTPQCGQRPRSAPVSRS